MKKAIRIFLFSLIAILPHAVSAHATGKSFDAVVNGYLTDSNYSPAPITAGDQTYFDFKIYKQNPPEDAAYDGVWVRVIRNTTTLFATDIRHTPLGSTGMEYTFETPGSYTVEAKYEKGDDIIATVSFPVDVGASAQTAQAGGIPLKLRLPAVIAIGFLMIVGALYLRKKAMTA